MQHPWPFVCVLSSNCNRVLCRKRCTITQIKFWVLGVEVDCGDENGGAPCQCGYLCCWSQKWGGRCKLLEWWCGLFISFIHKNCLCCHNLENDGASFKSWWKFNVELLINWCLKFKVVLLRMGSWNEMRSIEVGGSQDSVWVNGKRKNDFF